MKERFSVAGVICDVLNDEKTYKDYIMDLGEIRRQIVSLRKLYGNQYAPIEEHECVARIIENIINHELYEKTEPSKNSPVLRVVK